MSVSPICRSDKGVSKGRVVPSDISVMDLQSRVDLCERKIHHYTNMIYIMLELDKFLKKLNMPNLCLHDGNKVTASSPQARLFIDFLLTRKNHDLMKLILENDFNVSGMLFCIMKIILLLSSCF